MDLEASLTTLRTASVLFTGVLGILGALGKFRRKDGRLNKWGYATIGFILISTVISILTTLMEAKKEKTEALGQLARMEGLLNELTRVGQPITQLEVTFWVELPNTTNAVQEYITELDKAIDSRKVELRSLFPKTKDLRVAAVGLNDELLDVDVRQESTYWPKDHKKIIGDIARTFRFMIYIRKHPIKPELFRPLISTNPGFSDWIVMSIPLKSENRISMNVRDKKLYIAGSGEYEKALWKANGKITSIKDLYGSQLFLLPPNTFDLELPARLKSLENPLGKTIIRSMKIKTILLKFSSGREIWIDGDKFTKSKYEGGAPIFSIVLPSNENELLDLASKE